MSEFSPLLIGALSDVITGGSGNDIRSLTGIYRSGSKIEQFFLECGVNMRVGSSSRLSATMDALRDIFAQEDVATVKRVILRVCDQRDYVTNPENAGAVIARLNAALELDGYVIMMVREKPELIRRAASGAIVSAIVKKTVALRFDTVQQEIARALGGLSDDPEVAITAACSLIESVCRSILIELDLPLPPKKDVDGLIRAVQEPLGLSPSRTDLPIEIESDIRQILGGLTTVVKGIGALRTHGGNAHGRGKGFRRVDARIARFALYAAESTALFLIDTWEQRHRRALPLHEVA